MAMKDDLNHYREQLVALLGRLDRDRSQLKEEVLRPAGGEAGGGLSDVPLHLADLGSHGFEEELSLDLMHNTDEIIGEIKAALARLDEGKFGRCEDCRKPISKARLRAVPYARLCARCARKRPLTPAS
jgi:RNA polymerase-binding transcription factor DksA